MIKPSFNFAPGQWVFLQVPEVSPFQWHPVGVMLVLAVSEQDADALFGPSFQFRQLLRIRMYP